MNRTIPFFYFDYNCSDFETILDLYRHGSLHVRGGDFGGGPGGGGCALAASRDLEYWGIDETIFEPCCALKYHQVLLLNYSTPFQVNIDF